MTPFVLDITRIDGTVLRRDVISFGMRPWSVRVDAIEGDIQWRVGDVVVAERIDGWVHSYSNRWRGVIDAHVDATDTMWTGRRGAQ